MGFDGFYRFLAFCLSLYRVREAALGADFLMAIVWVTSCLLSGLVVIAFRELIQLFIDIEANTRVRLSNPARV